MLIVDAQVHIWKSGTPVAIHRQIPSYTEDDLLKEMDEGGVDAALLHPPCWDPNANEIAIEAAAKHPDRLAVLGFFDVSRAENRSLIADWKSQPGMLGLRFAFLCKGQENWLYIGNVMLLILNLPAIGLWVRLLKIPYQYLFPLILLFCLIGAYTINNSATDVFVMLIFGLVGYLMRKFNYEGAPMVLALVLGPMIEQAFRQSLNMSGGSFDIFFQRPVSAVTLIIAVVITALSALPSRRKLPLGDMNG